MEHFYKKQRFEIIWDIRGFGSVRDYELLYKGVSMYYAKNKKHRNTKDKRTGSQIYVYLQWSVILWFQIALHIWPDHTQRIFSWLHYASC